MLSVAVAAFVVAAFVVVVVVVVVAAAIGVIMIHVNAATVVNVISRSVRLSFFLLYDS